MPHYDYECVKCGYVFEVFQKMTDDLLVRCPECKGRLRRLIGAGAGLIFKGTGFYITDYKNKKAAADNSQSEKDAPQQPASPSGSDKNNACSIAKSGDNK